MAYIGELKTSNIARTVTLRGPGGGTRYITGVRPDTTGCALSELDRTITRKHFCQERAEINKGRIDSMSYNSGNQKTHMPVPWPVRQACQFFAPITDHPKKSSAMISGP